MPSMTAGMYSLGMAPPTILFSISTPLPFSFGCNRDAGVAVLAATAGLADELAFAFGRLGDGFAIGDLRRAGVGLHLELAHAAGRG